MHLLVNMYTTTYMDEESGRITGVGDYCKEWDKVVHTKTDFTEADETWWAAKSKEHDEKPKPASPMLANAPRVPRASPPTIVVGQLVPPALRWMSI